MFYYDIVNQIDFLITALFSFLIFVFVICMNKDLSKIRLLGISFFIPFLLSIASFLSINESTSLLLLIYADMLLLLAFALLSYVKLLHKNQTSFSVVCFIFPVITILASYYFKALSSVLSKVNIVLPLFLLLGVANLFFLKREKDTNNILFGGVILLTLSLPVKMLFETNIISQISLLFKFAAYLAFFIYFYTETYRSMMGKVIEADKKIAIIDKSLNLEVKKRVFEIEQSNQKLVNISKTDALTKTLNKKAIMDSITDLISSKPNSVFSIMMFDIDNFKIVNDTMGHIVGDKCIKKVATIGFNCIRYIDSLGRYGGDEFIILLPGSTSLQAKIIAERFRKRVDESDPPHFTVSVGIATYPGDGTSVKDLIATADDGLYISKKKGKNAVSHKNNF